MDEKKEYIERGALLKMSPFTVYGAVVSEYAEGYLDCAEEARKAVNDAPAADVVSKGVYNQVKWERDMAMQQLEEHGIPFGAKADVVEVVRCKDCIENPNYKCKNGMVWCRKFRTYVNKTHFCSYGERKE